MLRFWVEKITGSLGLAPFVFVGNVLGMFPCKYANKHVRAGGFVSRCYACLVFGARMWVIIDLMPRPKISSEEIIFSVMTTFSTITTFLALIIDFFISVFRINQIVTFFDKLAEYDARVARLGHPHRDRYEIYWIFLGLMLGLTCHVIEKDYEIMRNSPWTVIVWRDMYLIASPLIYRLSILKFDFFVHLAYQRFRHLNAEIMPSVSWTRKLSPRNLNSVTANDVIFLHSTLLDASTIVDSTFSVLMLIFFSSLYFICVVDTYLMSLKKVTSPVAYCYSAVCAIFVTCNTCHIAAGEANAAGKYMVKDEPTLIEDSTAMDRVRMQLYLIHNRVRFSGGDFFVIHLPVFYSIVVSIATYGLLLTKSHQDHENRSNRA